MDTIREQAYWNQRYADGNTSGYGSYGEQLQKKLALLAPLTGIQTVLEIGCGDFNFGKHIMFQYKLPLPNYTGYDISDVVLDRNRGYYPTVNWTNEFPTKGADLVLCCDVLFHIYEKEASDELLNNLKKLWQDGTYLALTAYEYDGETPSSHVKIRKFDPSRFGVPIIREVVEDDGQLYFYVFKRGTMSALPESDIR